MARAVISDPRRRTAYEPLYDIDPQTGASVEIFYADRVLATSFGTRWRGVVLVVLSAQLLPDGPPTGPFATSYAAYRNFALNSGELQPRPRRNKPPNAMRPLIRSVNADIVRTQHFPRGIDLCLSC